MAVFKKGAKVKTRKAKKFLVGADMILLPKGTKGTIVEVNPDVACCYRVKLYGLNADAWLKPYDVEKRIW